MNPFDTLSDDPILHILSYLPRDDLLKLSQMDTKFNRIITESRETQAKIPLILNFELPIAYDDAIKLASKRKFSALKLKNISKVIPRKFTSLLQNLSGSVEHLEICGSRFHETQFRKLIQLLIPKLKTCDVSSVIVEHNINSCTNVEVISNVPLKSLAVYDTKMLKFFVGCNQLKSFRYYINRNADLLYEFLSQQPHLEKLQYDDRHVDLSRVNWFQLKELALPCGFAMVSELLEMLPNLTKLRVALDDHRTLHQALETICQAPKLEHLDILIRCKIPNMPLKIPVNQTVKTLRIHDEYYELTVRLLQMFHGVQIVALNLDPSFIRSDNTCTNFHDPSDLSHETIDKIQFLNAKDPLHIQFSPQSVPANSKSFESAVMKFAQKFSTKIGVLTIGHENWSRDGNFRLSNSFCESLVNCLPNLTELELYNVANRQKLHSFLKFYQLFLKNLKSVKMFKTNDGEPKPKKLKIDDD